MNSIQDKLRLINTNREVNSILALLQEKTGLQRDYLIYCNVHV